MNLQEFNFYGVLVRVSTDSDALKDRLARDFSYFDLAHARSRPSVSSVVTVAAHQTAAPLGTIPDLPSMKQSANSLTYEQGRIRYNDYYGEAVSVFDYERAEARVFSPSLDRLHEVTFLLILSRVEKALDLRGLHKIHAFGISYRGTHLICQMPSKGGKTSSLLELIKDPEVELLSDDTPLVTRFGRVLPFPLRIGVDRLDGSFPVDSLYVYDMDRKHYGKKQLVDIRGLRNRISTGGGRSIYLLTGIRCSDTRTVISRCSKFLMVFPVVKNMVVGLGLPMVLEYFLETGFRDLFRKSAILASRSVAMFFLLARAKTYRIELGTDIGKNARHLKTFLLERVVRLRSPLEAVVDRNRT